MMRIAFLSNEFVTEKTDGGLATYQDRVARVLLEMGHEPEIFVIRHGNQVPDVVEHHGIRVEHVRPELNFMLRQLHKADRRLLRSPWNGVAGYLGTALGLARALERRHQETPFAIVQSSNNGASGLFVRRVPQRPNIVRLSSHRGLWWRTDGIYGPGAKLMIILERLCIRRANLVYAPSLFVADQCRISGWRNDVHVIRPPWHEENNSSTMSLSGLPSKYLLHFGQIGKRKGSDAVASALQLAWREEPDLCMIWAGSVIKSGEYERCHKLFGERSTKVVWLGTVSKAQMCALLQNAQAAVLPSRVDNLPNTMIESLMMGIPVLGFNTGSIDELVKSGVNGELVPLDDVKGLAQVMIKAWRGNAPWSGAGFKQHSVLNDLEPQTAVTNLVRMFEMEIQKLSG